MRLIKQLGYTFLFAGIKSDFVDFFHTFVVLSTGIYTSKNGYVNMYMLDF